MSFFSPSSLPPPCQPRLLSLYRIWRSHVKDHGIRDDYLKMAVPNAVIGGGDYPAERGIIEVTVILSQLSDVPGVRDFYSRSAAPPG